MEEFLQHMIMPVHVVALMQYLAMTHHPQVAMLPIKALVLPAPAVTTTVEVVVIQVVSILVIVAVVEREVGVVTLVFAAVLVPLPALVMVIAHVAAIPQTRRASKGTPI